jgi:hypothetical protein
LTLYTGAERFGMAVSIIASLSQAVPPQDSDGGASLSIVEDGIPPVRPLACLGDNNKGPGDET